MMRRRHTPSRRVRVAYTVVAATVALVTTGCVSQTEPAPTNSTGQSAPPNAITDVTDQPGTTEGYVGARDDVEIEACEYNGEHWVAKGTVENPTDAAQDYRIYVSWLEGSDTRGVIQTNIDALAPGASKDWNVSASLPGEDLECVLRVERFAVDGTEG